LHVCPADSSPRVYGLDDGQASSPPRRSSDLAHKHQPGDYSAQETLIAQLAAESEEARAQVAALMEAAKANMAATGPSLGELKKAAANAAIALANGQTAYQTAVANNDASAIRQWQLELTKLATAHAQAQRNRSEERRVGKASRAERRERHERKKAEGTQESREE